MSCHSCHTGWSSRPPDWLYPSQAATNSPVTQDECPSRVKLWGQHYMALPAQLHASAALAPYCLKNCDADAPGQKLENLPKGGMAQAEQEGRVRSSRRVCRSKRRVAISKRIVVRSNKSVQVQKKCNEVQKKCFPWRSICQPVWFENQGGVAKLWSIPIREKNSSLRRVQRGTSLGFQVSLCLGGISRHATFSRSLEFQGKGRYRYMLVKYSGSFTNVALSPHLVGMMMMMMMMMVVMVDSPLADDFQLQTVPEGQRGNAVWADPSRFAANFQDFLEAVEQHPATRRGLEGMNYQTARVEGVHINERVCVYMYYTTYNAICKCRWYVYTCTFAYVHIMYIYENRYICLYVFLLRPFEFCRRGEHLNSDASFHSQPVAYIYIYTLLYIYYTYIIWYIYMYVYIYMSICMYVYVYMSICLYVYMSICVYIYL